MSEFGVELMTVFLSFICLALGNKVPEGIEKTNLNMFKHNLKKHHFKELGKSNFFKKNGYY